MKITNEQRFTEVLLPIAAGVLLVLFGAWAQIPGEDWLRELGKRLELVAYDMRIKSILPTVSRSEKNRVVVAEIDEKSITELGRWPWSRSTVATLIDRLYEEGATIVAFDVVFGGEEKPLADRIIQLLKQQNIAVTPNFSQQIFHEFDFDNALESSLRDRDVVLGYILHNEKIQPVGGLPNALPLNDSVNADRTAIMKMESYTANSERFQSAALSGGFVTTRRDMDGILRRSPLVLQYGKNIYPSLSLEAARQYLLEENVSIDYHDLDYVQALDTVNLGAIKIPTDISGNILIPYRGPARSFAYYSASDIVYGRTAKGAFENKIVLIGATALGLTDLIPTPLQGNYPGVEVHANIIESILEQRFIHEPVWALALNLSLSIGLGGALAFILPLLNVFSIVFVLALLLPSIVIANFSLWYFNGFSLNFALPIALIFFIGLLNFAFGFFRENQKRAWLKKAFGQYVPPEVVHKMLMETRVGALEGETRELSILFLDIKDFTTTSEKLTPEQLKNLLNRFLTALTKEIFQHKGTIDKYIGDMIMAFWGAPLDDPDHATHAILTAQAMLKRVKELKIEFESMGLPPVDVGIGINTGVVNVGDMGSEYRRAYTAIGDAVNLASRLEGLTRFYQIDLIVGENTRNAVSSFSYRKLDIVRVKGKQNAVSIFEPVGPSADISAEILDELRLHDDAFAAYLARRWNESISLMEKLLQISQHKRYYELFIARIRELSNADLPDDWSGVYDRRTK